MKITQKNFKVLLPPPNVTGNLHLGHAWNSYIQDFFIRYYDVHGYQTKFMPGLDHAGIATQAKVIERIKNENPNQKITKEYFLRKAFEWNSEYSENIKKQWDKLDIKLNLEHLTFTLDTHVQKLVKELFIFMFKNKLIYQDFKIVNWDPKLNTAVSDIEIIKKDSPTKMYYFKYFLENDKTNFLTVATTRPETMFGDTAIFVNPKDARYKKYHNKFVINPVNGHKLPILTDTYVDVKFGSGAMKCTPAHDFNDFELGKKHKLQMPVVMNNKAEIINIQDEKYLNKDRFEVRKLIIENLSKQNLFIKEENHSSNLSFSERSGEVIEPLLSQQWFVKVKDLVSDVLKNQKNKKTKINVYPIKFEKTLNKWLTEMHDWCISRQLWWGHQLPVFFNEKKLLVSEIAEKDMKQIDDVLDTWFSSCLWGYVFHEKNFKSGKYLDFIKNILQKNNLITSDCLFTAYDILFFWVARMLIMTSAIAKATKTPYAKNIQFKNVFIHGLIRDEQNRKMSKSLNNGINPITLVDKYGSDAVRKFLLEHTTHGLDLVFSYKKIEEFSTLKIKLENVFNFIKVKYQSQTNLPVKSILVNDFSNYLNDSLLKIEKQLSNNVKKYQVNLYVTNLLKYFYDEFCSKQLEATKLIANIEAESAAIVISIFADAFKKLLRNFIPICPTISNRLIEELSNLKIPSIKIAYKKSNLTNQLITAEIVNRKIRQNWKQNFEVVIEADLEKAYDKNIIPYLEKAFNWKQKPAKLIEKLTSINENKINMSFSYENLGSSFLDQLKADLSKATEELSRAKNILSNKAFVSKAPKEKITLEKEKVTFYTCKITEIKNNLKKFK